MDRLEHILERHLGRTAAPEELWDRIQNPVEQRSWNPVQQIAWALATALLVLAVLWGINARGARMEIRSAEATQIREWIRASTGLDVPLSPKTPASVRLLCARVINGGAEITYRAGNQNATLLVSRAGASGGRRGHEFLDIQSSWIMRGQLYRLTGDLRTACALCHG